MNEIIDEQEWVPPLPARVAERALVLSAVVCRSGLEQDAGNKEAEKFRQHVVNWLEQLNLHTEAEPQELKLLKTNLGGLSRKETMDGTWHAEALAVLAWALGKYELPTYDVQVDGPEIASNLGFLNERGTTVLHSPSLRSSEEINAFADHLFTLHWRLRQFSLDQAPMDFENFAKTAWFGPLSMDGIRLREKDLEIRGLPLSTVPMEEWREALSIVQERHQAVNWLQGQERIYSQVTTDT